MLHQSSFVAILVFLAFAAAVIGISVYLGRRAKSASGYFAAGGGIHWFVNGVAFAGDYLSAASFLGICGMIAFFGYDGFLYSIGYLAGWIVALFIIAEPLKRMGRFTLADALDNKFNSRGIKLSAAVSTLVISCFYLIPQMVGAGALVRPLLGLPQYAGVIGVGVIVTFIVTTAGMVSTTWVQFIKGTLLVVLCAGMTVLILLRGVTTRPVASDGTPVRLMQRGIEPAAAVQDGGAVFLTDSGGWAGQPFVRVKHTDGRVSVWRKRPDGLLDEAQSLTVGKDGRKQVNGLPQGGGPGQCDLQPVGYASRLPGDVESTGPVGPFAYLHTMQHSEVILWDSVKVVEADGGTTTVYFQKPTAGADFMAPGSSPTFRKVRGDKFTDKLDFLSLMLALFCGTASLPHILIRYYTVKDQASARKSTIVGIAAIGFFYVLTLFLGLGAMTSGALDVTDSNMAAPLLARSINELLFAVISAVAFTTVLGTVSGLIMAASGAVAHDLLSHVMQVDLDEFGKVRAAKIASVVVGMIAIALGICFSKMNVNFLVGWAFNIAASANLPSLLMLLFWKGTTKRGITASILTGMVASLGWILLSAQAYKDVYGWDPATAVVPFSQPAIVTIPLGFIVLVVVSKLTAGRRPE
jgi:cation/acetate symporter